MDTTEKIFLQVLVQPDPKKLNGFIRCYSAGTNPSSVRFLESFATSTYSGGFNVCSGGGDGLLLLHQVPCDSMLLWNPSSNKIREIPAPGSSKAFIAASPGSSKAFIAASGFGYDSAIQDYKIVTIVSNYGSSPQFKPQIFNPKSKSSWRTIQGFPDSNYRILSCQTTVFFGGAVHFLARLNEQNYVILRVDLAGERFVEETLSAPVSSSSIVDRVVFKVLEGKLSLQYNVINWDDNDGSHRFEVWTMMEYGDSDSWIQVRSVKYSTIEAPQAAMQNGDLLVRENSELFVQDNNGDGKRKVKMPPEIMDSGAVVNFRGIHTYSESPLAT